MSPSINNDPGVPDIYSTGSLNRSRRDGYPAQRKSRLSLIAAILLLCLSVLTAGSIFVGCSAESISQENLSPSPAQSIPGDSDPVSAFVPAPPESTSPLSPAPVPDEDSQNTDADYPDDFTVETADGGTFTLSEALQNYDLVLINLFATWCPPCAMEFPNLQEAWSQRSDKVAVIALSIEPSDTLNVLRDYATEKGLTFPIGRIDGTEMDKYLDGAIPTTVMIDRTGKVAEVEVGARPYTDYFLDLFDSYTDPGYDPSVITLTITAYDANWNGLAGVELSICDDQSCVLLQTDESGNAVFSGVPKVYHVQIVGVPDGRQVNGPSDFYTEPWSQQIEILLR